MGRVMRRVKSGSLSRLLLVAGLAVTGCSAGGEAAVLRPYPAEAGGVLGFGDVATGQVYAIDDLALCIDNGIEVTVTRVELIQPTGGTEIVSFSTLVASDGEAMSFIDDPLAGLEAAGYQIGGPVYVRTTCEGPAGTAGYTQLGIEVRYAFGGGGTGQGVRVHYRSGGSQRTQDYPLSIILCGSDLRDAPADPSDILPADCAIR